MKLAILYSGGKDSNYALYEASRKHKIKCLISIKSKNPYSYMFQTNGINLIKHQSLALNIPLIEFETIGKKEEELKDLKKAIKLAIQKYSIEGIVTGAINSIYQSSRIQKICKELNIWCFNPLWQKDQVEFLKDIIKNNFEVIIVSIASYPLNKNYLGRKLNNELLDELIQMQKKYKINPAGEGGEIETFVINSPLFNYKIKIINSNIEEDSENSAELIINEVKLIKKNESINN
ncbi:MAG: diphthine--ammonia ligase [Nanoarchaeota archaeon]